jgi:hypothetical protein
MNLIKRVKRALPERIEHARTLLGDHPMDRSMRRLFRTERACEGHHVIAQRSSAHRHRQGPKAARSAGGAKRSALHGAEHRCSIGVVMAGGVNIQAKGDHLTRRRVHIKRSVRPPRFSGQQLTGASRANGTC